MIQISDTRLRERFAAFFPDAEFLGAVECMGGHINRTFFVDAVVLGTSNTGIDEAQRQKAHSMQALTGLLQQTGFRNIHVYGDCRPEPPRENEQRWHFAALKPAELPVDQEAGR